MSGGDGQGPAATPWADDQALQRAFFDEMRALVHRSPAVDLMMTPVEVWAVISHLQLALRHPRTRGPSSEIAHGVADRLALALAMGPAMREVLRRGWDASFDVPGQS